MSDRPWLKALKATITERTAATNETPKKTGIIHLTQGRFGAPRVCFPKKRARPR
jgi:hypothetical protein